jgi:hypothetical protein
MWYFDSWAVLDGLAFVSRRRQGSIDTEATVFLSVPDLEPVPIGRISTALRAQRASFQDGFRNSVDDREFEFDDLGQIREVIRRAYLGGGLGPTPAPVEGLPISPFRRERSHATRGPRPFDGGSYYEAELKRIGWGDCPLFDFGTLNDPERREALLLHLHDCSRYLYDCLGAFGRATMLEFIDNHASQLHLPGPRESLKNWVQLLVAFGFWDDSFLENFSLGGIPVEFSIGRDRSFASSPFNKGILFHIPCPLRPTWSRSIHTLGHKLLLALVDRSYFASTRGLPEFIPVLFCSLIMVVTPQLSVSEVQQIRFNDYHRLLGRACEWLLQELPRNQLPSEVEREISDFAWSRLKMNPKRPRVDYGFTWDSY